MTDRKIRIWRDYNETANKKLKIPIKLFIKTLKTRDLLVLHANRQITFCVTYESKIQELFKKTLTHEDYIEGFMPMIKKFVANFKLPKMREHKIDRKTLPPEIKVMSERSEEAYLLFCHKGPKIQIEAILDTIKVKSCKIIIIANRYGCPERIFSYDNLFEGNYRNFIWDFMEGKMGKLLRDYLVSMSDDIDACFDIMDRLLGSGAPVPEVEIVGDEKRGPRKIFKAKRTPKGDPIVKLKPAESYKEAFYKIKIEDNNNEHTLICTDFDHKFILAVRMDNCLRRSVETKDIPYLYNIFFRSVCEPLIGLKELKIGKASIFPKRLEIFSELVVERYLKGGRALICFSKVFSVESSKYNVRVEMELIADGFFVIKIIFSEVDNRKFFTFLEFRRESVKDFVCDIFMGSLGISVEGVIERFMPLLHKMFRMCDCLFIKD
ncbi:MAG: hypothetical protein Hyperionvirus2_34 [Hyperionvirus sp.]|uniref:Uncharacterized protein n=1 Tax=Hyperionvirus sp. TaxID=2487770 RepID=A0A3G5A5Z4_9VIRU|nr:MAG: hypothetical protein Hyperionvirus2_34 [Hyperionvirus sp.]